jgi:hypothetical protein
MMREQCLKELTLEREMKENKISGIPPVETSQSETIDANSKIDSTDDEDGSDDDSVMVSNNTKLKKIAFLMTMMMMMSLNNRTQVIKKQLQK